MSPIHVGDIVQVGNGHTQWRVTGFWLNGERQFAELQRTDREWVRTSSVVDRLSRVEQQP